MGRRSRPAPVGPTNRQYPRRRPWRTVASAVLLGLGAPIGIVGGWASPDDRAWWLVGTGLCAGLGALAQAVADPHDVAPGPWTRERWDHLIPERSPRAINQPALPARVPRRGRPAGPYQRPGHPRARYRPRRVHPVAA